MLDARIVAWIRDKYAAIGGDLDELGRRRWASAKAQSLGRGGIAAVALATGISDRTIRNGNRELETGKRLAVDRQRRPRGGRRKRETEQEDLLAALCDTRCSLSNPLRNNARESALA
jgi:hypothetical protein